MRIGKVVSNEALCSGYPEELSRAVERAERFTNANVNVDQIRNRITSGVIKIEPVDEENSDLKPFGYSHMTEWLGGDAYFVEVINETEGDDR